MQGATDRRAAQQWFVKWISEPQHWNKHTYSLNNPLRYVDPNGEDPVDALVVLKQAVQRLVNFRGLVKQLVSKGNIASTATQLALDTLLGKSIVFGKNCRKVSDEDFYAERRKLEEMGNVYTGCREFFESGQI